METQATIERAIQKPTMNGTTSLRTSTTSASQNDVCPECKGNGWILYKPSPSELEYAYGGEDLAGEYARKCPKCNGGYERKDYANIPNQYEDAYYPKFEWDIYGVDTTAIRKIADSFVYDFRSWQAQGKGLYISSSTSGSGKTYLSACIGRSVMMKYNLRFKFVGVIDYINKVSEGYTLAKQGILDNPSENYKDVDLLVIDDIGTQLDKPWQSQELFKLINTRMSNNLITIYTSNYRVDKLNVDDRIRSRIMGTTIQIPMPEVSIRQKKALENQNDFLRNILSKQTENNENPFI